MMKKIGIRKLLLSACLVALSSAYGMKDASAQSTLADSLKGRLGEGSEVVGDPVAPTGRTFQAEGNGSGNSLGGPSAELGAVKIDQKQLEALTKALKVNNLQISEESLSTPDNTRGGVGAEIRKEAFNRSIAQMMPMTPKEIRRLLEIYQNIQEAVETPINPQPKKHVTLQTISLEPGVEPPVIRMTKNHVTTVTFLDVTGQPWPIRDLSWAGPFEIEPPQEGSHILRIIPQSDYAGGNMSLTLFELDTPIIFTLKTSFTDVQYRQDIRVPQFGPKAESPLMDGRVSFTAGDEFISSVLEGVPSGSDIEKVKLLGVDGRSTAYLSPESMYLRTPHTLLSPAWDSSIRSADGMNVYVMSETPVLLLSDKGRVVRAYLNKEED